MTGDNSRLGCPTLRRVRLFLGAASWLGVGTLCTCNLPNMVCADAPGAASRRLSRTCGPDGAPGCPLGTYPRWRARALLPASGRYPPSASARIARRAVASPGEGLIRGSRASSGSRQRFGGLARSVGTEWAKDFAHDQQEHPSNDLDVEVLRYWLAIQT